MARSQTEELTRSSGEENPLTELLETEQTGDDKSVMIKVNGWTKDPDTGQLRLNATLDVDLEAQIEDEIDTAIDARLDDYLEDRIDSKIDSAVASEDASKDVGETGSLLFGNMDAVTELRQLRTHTTTDGLGEIEINHWRRDRENNRVCVDFTTPTMDRESEWMEWPRGGEDTKFTELLASKGLALDEADRLRGMEGYAEYDPEQETWVIVPEVRGVRDWIRKFQTKHSLFTRVRYVVEAFTALMFGTGTGATIAVLIGMSLLARARGSDEIIKMDTNTFAYLFLIGMGLRMLGLFALIGLGVV